jgi:hypothetical protein
MKTGFKMFVMCWYRYNETNFSVDRNGYRILQVKHQVPMLYYWFSVGAENGSITWSANCDPEGEFMGHCILITMTMLCSVIKITEKSPIVIAS